MRPHFGIKKETWDGETEVLCGNNITPNVPEGM